MPYALTRSWPALAGAKTRVRHAARSTVATVLRRRWPQSGPLGFATPSRRGGSSGDAAELLREVERAAAGGDRGGVRRNLRRSLPVLRADHAAALVEVLDDGGLWTEFARAARRAEPDADTRVELIERAIARGRADAVRALHRPSDEPSLSAFRLGRAYEQACRWGSAAAAYRRAAALNRVDRAAWTARFYRMAAKAPDWGFEPEPYGRAWKFPKRPESARTGMVAPLEDKLLAGWLPSDGAPDDRVVVRLNGNTVADTYATTLVTLPDGRTYRQFTRFIGGLWSYAGAGDVVTVHARGATLPIVSRGHRHIVATRVSRADELFAKLERGHTIDKAGRVRMSIRSDREWQQAVYGLFTNVRADVEDGPGHVIFPFYGTLLGAVREGDFIGHDNDFDAAYISRHSTPRRVKDEFAELGRFLISRGYAIEPRKTCVWIHLPGTDARVDLFYTWFDTDGRFNSSYGYHGRPVPRTDRFFEYQTRRLGSFQVSAPSNAEDIVAQLYGEGWRRPDPGFLQQSASRVVDSRYHLNAREVSDLRWNLFYRDHDPPDRETGFARYVADRLGGPGTVIEFGCGAGRDSAYLARRGWTALASDRSANVVSLAKAAGGQFERTGSASFEIVDVASGDDVDAYLARHAAVLDGAQLPVVYLRSLLHAIDEAAERTLLRTLVEALDQGFVLAAEFRTLEDRSLGRACVDRYRRYIDHRRFAERLRAQYGFHVEDVEAGRGLSSEEGDDPHLARVVARLPARSHRRSA